MRTALALMVLLSALPAAAWELKRDSTGEPVRWLEEVVFVVDAQLPERLGEPLANHAVQRAVEAVNGAARELRVRAWSGATSGMGFNGAKGAQNANEIVVPDTWTFDESALAVTVVTVDVRRHVIIDADIALNAVHRTFRVLGDEPEPGASFDDIQNTLTHELGHAVGLAHSPEVPEAVMYPGARKGEISKRQLTSDDREGLGQLYGMAESQASASPGQDEVAYGCAAAPFGSGRNEGFVALGLGLGFFLLRRRRGGQRAGTTLRARTTTKWKTAALAASTFLFAHTAQGQAEHLPQPQPPADKDKVLARASRILTGEVVSARTLPPAEGQTLLHTELEVRVRTCIKGECPATFRVRVPGGRVGDLEQIVAHQPVPKAGAVLAVSEEPWRSRLWRLGEPQAFVQFARALEVSGLRVDLALPGSLQTPRAARTPSPTP